MKSFETEYARLNPDQRRAVDLVEGPVMVVAGPGTGKTQTVAMRVANILQKTQAKPGNILCLTFSNSGATAMRERLRKLIGPNAYGVHVNTIHGFCNEIILQNPQVFEQWSALEQISDVERYRAVRSIIDEMMPDLELVNKKDPSVFMKFISSVKSRKPASSFLLRSAIKLKREESVHTRPFTVRTYARTYALPLRTI